MRRESDDDASSEPLSDEVIPSAPDMVFTAGLNDEEYITCLASSADGRGMFCGRMNGTIAVIDLVTGNKLQDLDLFGTRYSIRHMVWTADHKLLLCLNEVLRCIVVRLVGKPGLWQVGERVMDRYLNSSITQVLVKPTGDAVFVATPEYDEVLSIKGDVLGRMDAVGEDRRWVPHPNDPELLLRLHNNAICIYKWTSLQNLTVTSGISTPIPDSSFLSLSGDWACRKGFDCLIRAGPINVQRLTGFVVVDVSKLGTEATKVPTVSCSKKLTADIKHVLGLHKSSLVFLDTKGWICSISKTVAISSSLRLG